MLRAVSKKSVPEFTIVKAEAKAPHVAPALNAFPKRSAIPQLVGYPAETVVGTCPCLEVGTWLAFRPKVRNIHL